MGLFGDLLELVVGIGEAVVELQQNVADITVTTASMIVTGDTELKPAYEIREEADALIEKSNSRYKREYELTEKKMLGLEAMQKNLYRKKRALAKEINYKIQAPIALPTNMAPLKLGEPCENKVTEILPALFKLPLYKVSPFAAGVEIIGAMQRKEDAQSYKSKAKDYKVQIDGEIAKLKRLNMYIQKILGIFKEEEEILGIIKQSLHINRPLYYKKIAEELEILLIDSVLDINGQENQRYEKAVKELQEMMNSTNNND